MGLTPSKEKILKTLEKSITNPNINELKIEYKYQIKGGLDSDVDLNKSISSEKNIEDDDFNFSLNINIDSELSDVKNIKKYPYNTVGTLIVKFPNEEEVNLFTCFLIDTNVVVTLASNLINNNKGGKATSILTTFSEEKVKWENIFIQGDEKKKKDKKQSIDSINFNSKLAIILYEDNLGSEWIGVELGSKDAFNERDINCIFSHGLKKKKNSINEMPNKGDINEPYLKQINVSVGNPFIKSKENNAIMDRYHGSPLYYKDYNNGIYVIGVLNDNLEYQYIDKDTMIFLINMANKGKLLKKKKNKGLDEENIVTLDLSKNDFGPLDIKYLIDFDLHNLRILDLSSNLIGCSGASYLKDGKFTSLESLNLNANEIGDEGLKQLADGVFSKLNSLYLFNNNISDEGIGHLVKAIFTKNLIILCLSENKKIGDTGIRIIKEHKVWDKLNTLNLNATGLTDVALGYFIEASMPKLKQLNILGNKFTENGRSYITTLRKNRIHVIYRTPAERMKEKDKKKKKKEN